MQDGNYSKVELFISTELQSTIIAVLSRDGNYKRNGNEKEIFQNYTMLSWL